MLKEIEIRFDKSKNKLTINDEEQQQPFYPTFPRYMKPYHEITWRNKIYVVTEIRISFDYDIAFGMEKEKYLELLQVEWD